MKRQFFFSAFLLLSSACYAAESGFCDNQVSIMKAINKSKPSWGFYSSHPYLDFVKRLSDDNDKKYLDLLANKENDTKGIFLMIQPYLSSYGILRADTNTTNVVQNSPSSGEFKRILEIVFNYYPELMWLYVGHVSDDSKIWVAYRKNSNIIELVGQKNDTALRESHKELYLIEKLFYSSSINDVYFFPFIAFQSIYDMNCLGVGTIAFAAGWCTALVAPIRDEGVNSSYLIEAYAESIVARISPNQKDLLINIAKILHQREAIGITRESSMAYYYGISERILLEASRYDIDKDHLVQIIQKESLGRLSQERIQRIVSDVWNDFKGQKIVQQLKELRIEPKP